MVKNLRNMKKLIIVLIFIFILCLAIISLLALFPEDNSPMTPVNGISPRRITPNSSQNRQHHNSAIASTRTVDTLPTIVTLTPNTETSEKENRPNFLLELDSFVKYNSDGTNTIAENIEVKFGDIVFRIPKGTVIESDNFIRVGAQEVQIIDAAGNIETFPPGHTIGFSYFEENTSEEVRSFDILGIIKEQQRKAKSTVGCNNISTTIFQSLVLLLYTNRKRKD